MKVTALTEQIKYPKHYIKGIECWDYIASKNLNYFEGNIIKYITRWRHKNGVEDLLKAQAYLNKLICLSGDTGGNSKESVSQGCRSDIS